MSTLRCNRYLVYVLHSQNRQARGTACTKGHRGTTHTLSGEPASLLMIDMDQFKLANDRFGHDVGDAALRTVGECLVRVFLRRCDMVCRFGGDEFAVMLSETPGPKAVTLGERVASAVREARLPDRAASLSLNLSIGIAELARGDSAATWLQRADAALYAAKKAEAGR